MRYIRNFTTFPSVFTSPFPSLKFLARDELYPSGFSISFFSDALVVRYDPHYLLSSSWLRDNYNTSNISMPVRGFAFAL
jgi:hypothetical protein